MSVTCGACYNRLHEASLRAFRHTVVSRKASQSLGEGRLIVEVIPGVVHADELAACRRNDAMNLRFAKEREEFKLLEELERCFQSPLIALSLVFLMTVDQ